MDIKPPANWYVPSDASMMAFPVLACILTKKQSIHIKNPIEVKHSLGHEVMLDHLTAFGIHEEEGMLSYTGNFSPTEIDLRDANDLAPLRYQRFLLSLEVDVCVGLVMHSIRRVIESNPRQNS